MALARWYDLKLGPSGGIALSASGDLAGASADEAYMQQICLTFLQKIGGLPWAPELGSTWAGVTFTSDSDFLSAATELRYSAESHPATIEGSVEVFLDKAAGVTRLSLTAQPSWRATPLTFAVR